MKGLFDRIERPLATEVTPGSPLAGLRLVAIDGTALDAADTVLNDEFFGRPGVSKGERAPGFRRARLVALAEWGTHTIFGAEIGPCTTSARGLSKLQQAAATGADLL